MDPSLPSQHWCISTTTYIWCIGDDAHIFASARHKHRAIDTIQIRSELVKIRRLMLNERSEISPRKEDGVPF